MTVQPQPCPQGTYVRRIFLNLEANSMLVEIFQQASQSLMSYVFFLPQCPKGTPSAIPCPAGTHSSSDNLASEDGCKTCPLGFACALGTSAPEPCAAGRFGGAPGQTSRECSGACIPGFYCDEGSTTNTSGVCRKCLIRPNCECAHLRRG